MSIEFTKQLAEIPLKCKVGNHPPMSVCQQCVYNNETCPVRNEEERA